MLTEHLVDLIHEIQHSSALAKSTDTSSLPSADKSETEALHSQVSCVEDMNSNLQRRLMTDTDVTLAAGDSIVASGDAKMVRDTVKLKTDLFHSQRNII